MVNSKWIYKYAVDGNIDKYNLTKKDSRILPKRGRKL